MDIRNVPEFAQFTTNAGNLEILQQSVYDSAVYPTAGTTELAFFTTPYNQGKSAQPGWATKTKTIADTNLKTQGRLPEGYAMRAESLEVAFLPGSDATADTFALQSPVAWNAVAAATLTVGVDDVNAFYNTGLVEFQIGDKIVCQEAPIGRFPPKTYREIGGMVATNSATTAEALFALNQAKGRSYFFGRPITIMPNETFSVTLRWAAVVATPSGKNGQVKVILDGQLGKKV